MLLVSCLTSETSDPDASEDAPHPVIGKTNSPTAQILTIRMVIPALLSSGGSRRRPSTDAATATARSERDDNPPRPPGDFNRKSSPEATSGPWVSLALERARETADGGPVTRWRGGHDAHRRSG